MKISLRVAVVACITLSLAANVAAQGADSNTDLKEVTSYRLTMEGLKKVQTATRLMAAAMKNDPRHQASLKLEAEIEALEKKDELTDAEQTRLESLQQKKEELEANDTFGDTDTLSDMAAAIAKEPAMASALKQAGMTPREYATFTMAMLQAAMVVGFKKSGLIKETPKEAGVNLENVKFVEDHAAELEAMQKEFDALRKGGGQ